jgi:hypothetical protein
MGGKEQEAVSEANRAYQLDPLTPMTMETVGEVHLIIRQFDEGIKVCNRVASENPTFAVSHRCLAYAYWGKRMFPQAIEEFRTFGQLSGEKGDVEFASAMGEGFRSAGWNGALTKAIEMRKAHAKQATHLRTRSPHSIPTWGRMMRRSDGLIRLIRSMIGICWI